MMPEVLQQSRGGLLAGAEGAICAGGAEVVACELNSRVGSAAAAVEGAKSSVVAGRAYNQGGIVAADMRGWNGALYLWQYGCGSSQNAGRDGLVVPVPPLVGEMFTGVYGDQTLAVVDSAGDLVVVQCHAGDLRVISPGHEDERGCFPWPVRETEGSGESTRIGNRAQVVGVFLAQLRQYAGYARCWERDDDGMRVHIRLRGAVLGPADNGASLGSVYGSDGDAESHGQVVSKALGENAQPLGRVELRGKQLDAVEEHVCSSDFVRVAQDDASAEERFAQVVVYLAGETTLRVLGGAEAV